jgi:hypothetical protein
MFGLADFICDPLASDRGEQPGTTLALLLGGRRASGCTCRRSGANLPRPVHTAAGLGREILTCTFPSE